MLPLMLTGNAVRIERGRLRMTQIELAEAIDVGKRTVQEWEANGDSTVPLKYQARLADLFAQPDVPALAAVTDLELVAELMRRLGTVRAGMDQSHTAIEALPGVASRPYGATLPRSAEVRGDVAAFSDDDMMVGSLEQRDETSAVQPPSRTHGGRRKRAGS